MKQRNVWKIIKIKQPSLCNPPPSLSLLWIRNGLHYVGPPLSLSKWGMPLDSCQLADLLWFVEFSVGRLTLTIGPLYVWNCCLFVTAHDNSLIIFCFLFTLLLLSIFCLFYLATINALTIYIWVQNNMIFLPIWRSKLYNVRLACLTPSYRTDWHFN